VGALPLAVLLHNHSLAGFFDYVYGALQLSSGYDEAMSLPAGTGDIFYETVMATLFFIGAVYASVKKALPWRLAAILFFLYWINLKHGFVRADDHTVFAFCFEIIIGALLIALLNPKSDLIIPYTAAFPFFVILALSGMSLHWQGVWTD